MITKKQFFKITLISYMLAMISYCLWGTESEFGEANKPLPSGSEDKQSTASVQLLEIQEFRHGESKPFVAISMGGAGIVTGLCK